MVRTKTVKLGQCWRILRDDERLLKLQFESERNSFCFRHWKLNLIHHLGFGISFKIGSSSPSFFLLSSIIPFSVDYLSLIDFVYFTSVYCTNMLSKKRKLLSTTFIVR